MPPTIRKALASETAQVSRTVMRAFWDDPVMRWLIPDDAEFESSHQLMFASWVRHWLSLETIWVTDDIVGFAGWEPPPSSEAQARLLNKVGNDVDELKTELLPGENLVHPTDRLERIRVLRSVMDENVPEHEYWHLNLLGTHPDWQRQGIGRRLMQPGFAEADRAGFPCYLETESMENVAYYRHHGFEVRSEWDVPLGGPHMWGMLRPVGIEPADDESHTAL